jgi:integrase
MTKRAKATTDRAIKNAKPETKAYKMSAGQGMYLMINPSGSKLWRLKYRYGGKEKVLSFGAYPDVSLRQANLLRAKARQLLAAGTDPRVEQEKERAQQKAQELTFKIVAERWFKGRSELARKPWAASTAKKVRLYLERDLYPAFGSRPIGDITRLDLIAVSEAIEKRGAFDIARKVREWLAAIFDEAFDRGEISHNPAYRLKPSHYAIGVKSEPNPFIPFDELPGLLAAVDASNSHFLTKAAVRLLVLTGVRTGELRFSTWQEFDLDNATWAIPAERMKMRRPHVVPLPTQVLALLQQVKTINPGGYLFVLRGSKPMSEMTINKVLKVAGYAGRQTGHGFRHLLSTELNSRGYNADWVELQLAHRVSDNKIRSTYNHADYLEQRRGMMQEWANSIDAIEQGANVAVTGRKT